MAALNHPNILQVYDWGEENDEPYLVLEYLAGGSLRQVYDTGALLTPEQAAQVGLEAAAGLDYAHRRGLVHRDIKPANLLFDADHRLRIADFGLARALAEAAWTEPDGAILGTARYAAPEQVEGWVLDGKADVYALALVLYEGVTGEAPFIGDTTVSTLMARMDALLPEHEALGPLHDVLVWAAAPDPAERYDASRLALELHDLAESLPEPTPLPIVDAVPVDDGGDLDSATVGRDRKRARGGEPGPLTELGVPALVGSVKEAKKSASPKKQKVGSPEKGPAGRPTGRRRWPWIAAIVVVVAALLTAGAVFAAKNRVFTPSHPIPLLVGKSLVQANQAVRADHFTVHQTGHSFSITLGPGLIVSQRPSSRAGGKPVSAKEGSTIGVVLSAGPPPVAIPNLSTFSNCNDAIQALQAVHLVGSVSAIGRAVQLDGGGRCRPRHHAHRHRSVRLEHHGHHLQGPRPGRHPCGERGWLHLCHRVGVARRIGVRPVAEPGLQRHRPHRSGRRHDPRSLRRPRAFRLRGDRDHLTRTAAGDHPRRRAGRVGGRGHQRPSGVGSQGGRPLRPSGVEQGALDRPRTGHLGSPGHDGQPLHAVTNAGAGCELCEAARITEWFHEDDICWVAACEVCDVPMVVWKQHGEQPPDAEVEHMLSHLGLVADAQLGAGGWSYDRVMRQIPDHFHAHARDPNWWFRRFSRR